MRGDRRSKSRSVRTARAEAIQEHAFVDRNGHPLYPNAEVRFHSSGGTVMRAVVRSDGLVGRMCKVRIAGDPFDCFVDHRQLTLTSSINPRRVKETTNQMPTATATPSAKELRRQAKSLGIRGWEEMSRDELIEAIGEADEEEPRPSKKASKRTAKASKKAPRRQTVEDDEEDEEPKARKSSKASKTTKKASAKKQVKADTNGDGPNPFRAGSNLYHITEALMKGGKRSALVAKLRNKLEFNPRVKSDDEFDVDAEIDRRLKVVSYILEGQHGFTREHTGRGPEATIKVFPPES